MISTLYSASPLLTLYRSLQLAVAIVLVISLRERLTHLYMLIVAYVAVNWVLFLLGLLGLDGGLAWLRGPDDLYVSYGGNEFEAWRFWTAFGHPSHISIVAAGIAAIGLSARASGRQWITHGPLVAWLLLTVMLTVSRTAIAATLLGLCLVAAGRRALLPVVGLGCALLFFALVIPGTHQTTMDFLMRGQSAEEFASLTGRRQADLLLPPWTNWRGPGFLGHGFRAARVYGLGDKDIVHAHNLILEVWHHLGFARSDEWLVRWCWVFLREDLRTPAGQCCGWSGPCGLRGRPGRGGYTSSGLLCHGFRICRWRPIRSFLVFLAVLAMLEVERQRLASAQD